MRPILLAGGISLFASLLVTPMLRRWLLDLGMGQYIREELWGSHGRKVGTPTMGGTAILLSALLGYALAHLLLALPFRAAGLVALGGTLYFGAVGFADDLIKARRKRSLGLGKAAKLALQAAGGVGLALAVLKTGSPSSLSLFRPFVPLPTALFLLWVVVMVWGATNSVNLTDGMDGLAAGSSAMVFSAYVVIAFWQFRHPCLPPAGPWCYQVRGSGDLAVLSAALLGAVLGFLWWNAQPADIFMGDTGSLALGGAMAALAVLTQTQVLLAILGGLYVLEALSVMAQVVSFRFFGKRVLRMAPIHHHFELGGWEESRVTVRFWILAGIFSAFGLALFYADYLARGGG